MGGLRTTKIADTAQASKPTGPRRKRVGFSF